MADPEPKAAALKNAVSQTTGETARWPLSFRIPPGTEHQSQQGLAAFGITSTSEKPKKRWWSHLLYRGPNDELVKVQYSKTKANSEILAKQFLNEKVVGFDMEWPWNDWKLHALQNKIGLIQVATEDKIALFHIGLHTGKTTDDIIAPSLRKLIESPAIGKIGVGILSADFSRLRKYFKLQPKGAVELSHLHRLVTFGERKPELVSTKMTSLAHQVEQHLGHPLYKGDVRTSNWSKPLSQEQIKYAAGDAYAGIMLYHCLNYKRLQMDPVPPMPIHAERYLGFKLAGIGSLYLEPAEEGGKIMTSAFFFGVPTALEDLSKSKKADKASKTSKALRTSNKSKLTIASTGTSAEVQVQIKKGVDVSHLDSKSLALYKELCSWNTATAAEGKSRIGDVILSRLAEQRPLTSEGLLGIKGLGKITQKTHGKHIIETIRSFMVKNNMEMPECVIDARPKTAVERTKFQNTPARKSRTRRSKTRDSSPAFGTPPHTPSLHTGLSFTLAETKLAEDVDSDSSLSSLDFGPSPCNRRTSGQKRKRPDSPVKKTITSQKAQHIHTTASTSSSTIITTPPELILDPLTPSTLLLRNKLTALSKFVATKTHVPHFTIASAETLSLLALNPPRSASELRNVSGGGEFAAACEGVGVDLLARIARFESG